MDTSTRSSWAGMKRPMNTAASPERTARAQKGPRQPVNWPAKEPIGTPTTLARVRPPIMTPVARVALRGPAALVATTKPTDQNAPVARAVTTRAMRTTEKDVLSAATRCPRQNTDRARTSVWRWGRRRVAMAMVGAPMIMPMAKAVISRPAWETLTPRSPASSGSRPATTNSVVPIRNVPAASTQTTKGSLPGVVPDAEGIRVVSPCVVIGGRGGG